MSTSGGQAIHHNGRPSFRRVQNEATTARTVRIGTATASGSSANGTIGSSDGGAAAKCIVPKWTDHGSPPLSHSDVPRR